MNSQLAISILAVLATAGASLPCYAVQTIAPNGSGGSGQTQTDESPVASRTPTDFLRLQTDEYKNPIALQTATAKFVLLDDHGNEELAVVLESVIHVADSSYFRGFDQRFEQYDSVLYESILKPKQGKSDDNDSEQPGGLEILQQLSTGTLGLAYQFDEVNYQADNMLNADLSPEEISERMQEREKSATTLFSDLLNYIFQKIDTARNRQAGTVENGSSGNRPGGIGMDLSVLTDPDGIMKIRRAMATVLVSSGLLESPLPPSIHRLIIGDRNDRAMSVLDAEIKKGKHRIAIFFGVGHMADFERRLALEYGMKKVSVNWRNAWDLRDGAIEGAPLEGLVESTFRDSLKSKLKDLARGVGHKKPADDETVADVDDEPAGDNDQTLEEMEKTLRELKAKLDELEKRNKQDKKGAGDSPDNTPSGDPVSPG